MPKKSTTKKKAPVLVGPDGTPFRKSEAWVRPERLVISIVGEPKFGKSSFIAEWGNMGLEGVDAFIIPTQPGLEGLDVNCPWQICPACNGRKSGCDNCAKPPGPGYVREIVATYAALKKWVDWGIGSPFNPIVIDPIAPAHDLCIREICRLKSVEDINKVPGVGTGWWLACGLLQRLLGPIKYAGKGLVVIAHLAWRDIIIPGGVPATKAIMNLGGKAAAYINQIVDIEMQFDVKAKGKETAQWIARVQPGPANRGGDRTGYLPAEFSRGKSAKAAAKTFLNFFYSMDD